MFASRSSSVRTSLLAAAGAAVLATTAPASAEAGQVRTTAKQRAVAASVALGKVGRPYRFGSAGPSAFDCSGLISFAYRLARGPLSVRTSYDMWRIGSRVSRKALRKGDLVFTWDRSLGHVGIYVGGNRYVHAPGSGRRVQVSTVPSGGGFIGARRP